MSRRPTRGAPSPRLRALHPAPLAALLAAVWVLLWVGAPLVEDSLFWWVPKGLLAAEQGPAWTWAGTLPEGIARGLLPQTTPHQWAGGLPDYAHPPLWFAWLGLFLRAAPTVQAAHLACLLPAVLAAVGFARLGPALGGHRWSGLAVLALPPVMAQLLRPELDLPLLAVVPWALLALLEGRWGRFLILGLLAPWLKEPGVLLVVPAVVAAAFERRWRWQALAPLVGLGAWSLVHGGLAQAERLPTDGWGWASDLVQAARIVGWEQGRWALLIGMVGLGVGLRRTGADRQRLGIGLSFALAWLVFFGTVGFLGGREALTPLTHVRYFLPGMAVWTLLMTRRWPGLAAIGLFWCISPSRHGPEASLHGILAGVAEADAAPWIASQVAEGHRVWVGSYQAAALTQPWAGQVEAPMRGFSIYDQTTGPGNLTRGDLLVVAAYGEPAGRLLKGTRRRSVERWQRGAAVVEAWEVEGIEAGSPP